MGGKIKTPRRNGHPAQVASREVLWDTNERNIGGDGIKMPPGLSELEWRRCAIDFSTFNNWDWGEWVAYGIDNFGQEATKKASKEYSRKTWGALMNGVRTIRGVRRELREKFRAATFSHFVRVASFPPDVQEELLQRCLDRDLSFAQLNRLIRDEYPNLMTRPPKKKDQESSHWVISDTVRVSYVPEISRIDILWGEEADAFRPTSNDHFVARVDPRGRLVGVSIYAAANLKAPLAFEVSGSADAN